MRMFYSKTPTRGFWHALLLKYIPFLPKNAKEKKRDLKYDIKEKKEKTKPIICGKKTMNKVQKKYLRDQLLYAIRKNKD